MQTYALEQARVEITLRQAAKAHVMPRVAIRLRDADPESLLRTAHGVMQAMFCLAIGLTITTIAINAFLRWLGW